MYRATRSALRVAIGAALAITTLTAVPAAAAAPQVVHTRVNVSLTNIDQCGFTVNSVVRGTNTLQVFVDRSGNVAIQIVSHVVSALTNGENGKRGYGEKPSLYALRP